MTDHHNSGFPDVNLQKQRTRRLQFILLALAALLTAGIILVSINTFKLYEEQTRSQLEQQLGSIGDLKSSQISTWMREHHSDAEVLKNSPGLPLILHSYIQNQNAGDAHEQLNNYLMTIIKEYNYDSISITDPLGLVLSSFPSDQEEPELFTAHDQFVINRSLETGQIEFLDLHRHAGEEGQRIYFSYVVPFYEEGSINKPLAAMVLTVNPDDFLYPLISSWPVPRETAETLLVKLDGEEVLFLNPLRFKDDAALNLRIPLKEAEILAVMGLTGKTGIVEGLDYRGQKVIGTLHRVAGTDWVMISKIDYDEFITPIQARRERAIFTTTTLLLISFALLFIIWRNQQLSYLQAVGSINEELERRVEERTAQLEVTKKELEAFAYSVSHDLRAPLRAMSGFSDLLQEEFSLKLGEDGQHYIDRIQFASCRMGKLIDDLLTLSRVTRSDLTYTQVDISKMASEIIDQLKVPEPDRLVEVIIKEGLTARGDQKLLTIALENLLNNAWKFSALKPQARIELGNKSTTSKHKTFFISDNGAGFEMDYSDKLFIPFQRLHRTDEFPGTGIGLSIVQRVVERHGGRIWAESEVGKGATFYFTLPQ